MSLIVKEIIIGRWSSNCYIISDVTKAAVVIDPGEGFDVIMKYFVDTGLEAKAIFLTHGHFDHIGTAAMLKETLRIPLLMHRADTKILKHANLYRQSFVGEPPIEIPIPDEYLAEQKALPAGPFSFEVIETPGHTQGSVCLRIGNYLFTGDTLLRGHIGRTDLPGGDRGSLINSLYRLSKLPLDTIVCPGHGALTSLADEMQNNVALREVLYGN